VSDEVFSVQQTRRVGGRDLLQEFGLEDIYVS
jgi:hypothetical protein